MRFPTGALYFPTIEFQNEDFLRRSLLYWDKIYRIVPIGYTPNDTDFVKELADAGMIKNITADYPTLQVVADLFMEKVNSTVAPAGLNPTVYDAGLRGDEFGRLHKSKVYHILSDLFSELGITQDNYGFLKVSNDFAGYYMLMLAREISRKRQIPLATDQRQIWDITPSFIENSNISEHSGDTDGKICLTSTTIEGLFPSSVSDITASQLVKIAKDSQEARANLRVHIGSVIDEIQKIESEDQAREELQDLIRRVEKDKKEFRKSLNFFKSQEFDSCLNLSIPTMATLFSLGNISPELKIGSFVYSMIQYFRNCRSIKKKRNASYQAYLVGLDKHQSRQLPTEVNVRNNEYLYD